MDMDQNVPRAVRKIISAMIDRAISRCEQSSIAQEDFCRAMRTEQRVSPKESVSKLIDGTFIRLRAELMT